MTLSDHHEWVGIAARQLMCGADALWHAMCIEWAKRLPNEQASPIVDSIIDALP
jgi:hypothetical protein